MKLFHIIVLLFLTNCSVYTIRVSSEDRIVLYRDKTCKTPCSISVPLKDCDSVKVLTLIKNSNYMASYHYILGCKDTVLYVR